MSLSTADLKAKGFSTKHLKAAGVRSRDLKAAGFSANPKAAGLMATGQIRRGRSGQV